VALRADESVWTFGVGEYGQLGHKDVHSRLVPTLLAGEPLGSTAVVLVAARG